MTTTFHMVVRMNQSPALALMDAKEHVEAQRAKADMHRSPKHGQTIAGSSLR